MLVACAPLQDDSEAVLEVARELGISVRSNRENMRKAVRSSALRYVFPVSALAQGIATYEELCSQVR